MSVDLPGFCGESRPTRDGTTRSRCARIRATVRVRPPPRLGAMRATAVLRNLTRLKDQRTVIRSFAFADDQFVLDVGPTRRVPYTAPVAGGASHACTTRKSVFGGTRT